MAAETDYRTAVSADVVAKGELQRSETETEFDRGIKTERLSLLIEGGFLCWLVLNVLHTCNYN